ncbi:MAG: ferritin-like domain-containing protein [Deltaproteobacteria bacterium]|nr:ferritin-like domain-containing protein [Deltaproteobacteria bacterium]
MIELATDVRLLSRFVDDLGRTAPKPMPSRPVLAAHATEDVEAARFAWATRISDEYRSVAIFAELLGLLSDLEAPFPALCAVQRLIGDELRHTQMTVEVVDWLGGSSDLEIDLRDVGLPPRRASETPAARALRIVAREIVVGEEESIFALAAYRNATTDPAIRGVLEQILTDEVRHAAAGRALLALFDRGELARATSELRAKLPELMAADRADLRAHYLDSATGGPGRALGACLERADLEALWQRVLV